MKVVHFIAGIDKKEGGTSEYMRLLGSELKNHIEVIVATGRSANPIDIKGVKIKFFETSVLRWFSMLNEFRSFLLAEKPDIVHINGIWSPQNWGFQKKAQELGIKVILSPHGMLEPWIMAQNSWKKRLGLFLYQRKAIQRAKCLHTTAEMEALNIQYLGFKTPIHIIPNGIDLNDIKGMKKDYGTKRIVFLSRIHPKKGVELLLEAWRNSNTNGWVLEIAGNGDENYIENLNQSARDLKNVNFVGAKYGQEKWDFLRSADVMILPTHSENFGIVVAEALAIGVPVVTTQGTPWEDLEIHECGWWINLSVSNLENIIAKIIKTPAHELQIMGEKGRKLVTEKYEIRSVACKISDLYKKHLTNNIVDLSTYSHSFSLKNKISRLIWNFARLILFRPFASRLCIKWRVLVLKCFGAKIDWTTNVYASVKIWAPWNLEIGKNSSLGPQVDCYNQGKITIGSNTIISQKTYLCASTHDYTQKDFPLILKPITIGDGVWVAADAFIAPGINIENHAVVAARSAVIKDVEKNTIVGGNPAKLIKSRSFE